MTVNGDYDRQKMSVLHLNDTITYLTPGKQIRSARLDGFSEGWGKVDGLTTWRTFVVVNRQKVPLSDVVSVTRPGGQPIIFHSEVLTGTNAPEPVMVEGQASA